jgi:hypothetical protein
MVILSYLASSLASTAASTLGAVSLYTLYRRYQSSGMGIYLALSILSLPLGIATALWTLQQQQLAVVVPTLLIVTGLGYELWKITLPSPRSIAGILTFVAAIACLQTGYITWRLDRADAANTAFTQRVTDGVATSLQSLQLLAERELTDSTFRAAWAAGASGDLQQRVTGLVSSNGLQRVFLANGLGEQVASYGVPTLNGNILKTYPWIRDILNGGNSVTGVILDPSTQQPALLAAAAYTTEKELRAILIVQQPLTEEFLQQSGTYIGAAISAPDTGYITGWSSDEQHRNRLVSTSAIQAYADNCRQDTVQRVSLTSSDGERTLIHCTLIPTMHQSSGITIAVIPPQ